MTTPAPAAGAMALLEKYSTLNRCIDEARQETMRLTTKIDQVQSKIQQLVRTKSEMEQATAVAREETTTLHDEIAQAIEELGRVKDDWQQATMQQSRAERLLQLQQRVSAERQADFLAKSRDFRQNVKRLRLTASEVGLDMAACQAFVELKTGHGIVVQDVNDDDELEQEELDDESLKLLEQQWHLEALENTSPTCGNDSTSLLHDVDMEQAMQDYQEAWKKHQATKAAHNQVVEQHEQALQSSKARASRKQQLLAQLERIRKENATYETQLENLEEETKISQAMLETFCKRANAKQQNNKNKNAAQRNNPYATNSARNSARSSARNNTTNTTAVPPPYTRHSTFIATTAQHPHMEGRRRVDRRFQSGLPEIQGASIDDLEQQHHLQDDDSDDEILSFAPFGNKSSSSSK